MAGCPLEFQPFRHVGTRVPRIAGIYSGPMARNVAFLRGVNVGGHGKFPMADFKRLLEQIGATSVKTHLNSGNAAFTSNKKPAGLQKELHAAIVADLGRPVDVVVRTAAQLRKVIDGDPFAGVADDGSKYVVLFLTGTPDHAAVKAIEDRTEDFAPEQFVHIGTEFYVWCPNSLRDAKLPIALADKKMGVAATARNWNTVKRMLELAEAES
jgi:uncharacterized protein (DUF1697 family)